MKDYSKMVLVDGTFSFLRVNDLLTECFGTQLPDSIGKELIVVFKANFELSCQLLGVQVEWTDCCLEGINTFDEIAITALFNELLEKTFTFDNLIMVIGGAQ